MRTIRLKTKRELAADEPIVITGIGMITALGGDRESTWNAVQRGDCAIDWIRGVHGIPDGSMFAAQVELGESSRDCSEIKAQQLGRIAIREAISDARIDWSTVDKQKTGCAIAGHMGDTRGVSSSVGAIQLDEDDPYPWWSQFMPNAACSRLAAEFGLGGPRLCHSTACASGLISLLTAVRAIRDGQCEVAIAGGGESINALFASGFRNMRALSSGDDPRQACLPFDVRRNGFVMGEGAAMFVVERRSHALDRGANIYCQITTGTMASEAHHLTGLEVDSEALSYLMRRELVRSDLNPEDIGYINAHGTGTEQNDAAEIAGISRVFDHHLNNLQVSATKSMIGHLVKASGCVELAVTVLGLRDGICPPTIGTEQIEPACRFDCVPRHAIQRDYQHAMKLSLAFGGHLVAVTVSRWNELGSARVPRTMRRAA